VTIKLQSETDNHLKAHLYAIKYPITTESLQ